MSSEKDYCDRCGATGTPLKHAWTEGDCLLGHSNGHPRATVGHICRGCVERLQSWLTEITELFAGLPDVIELGSVPDDTAAHGHVKKRPASPALVRLDAWAMLRDRDRLYRTGEPSDLPDVPAVLADLAYRVADDLGIVPPGDLGGNLAGAATFLATRIEQAARSAWIDELDADVKWVRRALRRAHGIVDVQALGKCLTVTDGRDCGGRVWPSRDGGDPRPRCDRCTRRYGTLDLVRLKRMNSESA